jgi:hypothetical protein
MSFHVGIHVLRTRLGSNLHIDSDSADDNTGNPVEDYKPARKTRKKRDGTAPQDQGQLNGAEPIGDVGGTAA